jgi:hypothetical protein
LYPNRAAAGEAGGAAAGVGDGNSFHAQQAKRHACTASFRICLDEHFGLFKEVKLNRGRPMATAGQAA